MVRTDREAVKVLRSENNGGVYFCVSLTIGQHDYECRNVIARSMCRNDVRSLRARSGINERSQSDEGLVDRTDPLSSGRISLDSANNLSGSGGSRGGRRRGRRRRGCRRGR